MVFNDLQLQQDGRSSSLTAPNGPAQQEVILTAWQEAQESPGAESQFSPKNAFHGFPGFPGVSSLGRVPWWWFWFLCFWGGRISRISIKGLLGQVEGAWFAFWMIFISSILAKAFSISLVLCAWNVGM